MKRAIIGFALVALAAVTSLAQPNQMTANVPFGFYVGDTWLPPGEVTLERFALSAIKIHNLDTRETAVRFAVGGPDVKKGDPNCALVFRRIGEHRYFLKEVVHPALTAKLIFRESRLEKEAVTSTLLTATKPVEVVILAALR